MTLRETLESLTKARTNSKRQELSAQIVSMMPEQLERKVEAEIAYNSSLKGARDATGTISEATIMLKGSEVYRAYSLERGIYEIAEHALPVLNMYTRD